MFGKRLRELRKQHHLSMAELSSQLNKKYKTKISKSMISRWENGTADPSLTYVRYIMDFFGKGYDFFMPDLEKKASNVEYLRKHDKHIVRIPVIGTIACGDPILADQNINGYTSELFNEKPDGVLFALKCKGDSMEPMIPNGAVAIIRMQPEVEDDEIAAVLVDDNSEATLKRVKHIPGGQVMLIPENKNYDPIILNKDNPGRILGKVIHIGYDL